MENSKQKGFTLIELLVAISITVILTTLFLVNYRGQASKNAINSSTAQIISDLHKLQSFSLASHDISAGVPSTRYTITFANVAASYSLVGYNNAIPAAPTTLSTSKLATGVTIQYVQVTKTNATIVNPASVTVAFKNPFGKVVTNYAGSTTDEVNDVTQIRIISADATVCSIISVNGITGNIVFVPGCT